ncbi:hypothetical protein HB662_01350 [Roseomonas frigidaquae]|uniref:Uncharacterized protein n=1 Tax=Falsiroseomonas frigidaquae TaxID=487318 RepID=A0ABX1ES03_9PROT|nr:hypothetical protein [Falsiroseomonas frigidaquae]NKE43405.1 hypothetical protein [Falsiroseomonas frigidaquae]
MQRRSLLVALLSLPWTAGSFSVPPARPKLDWRNAPPLAQGCSLRVWLPKPSAWAMHDLPRDQAAFELYFTMVLATKDAAG